MNILISGLICIFGTLILYALALIWYELSHIAKALIRIANYMGTLAGENIEEMTYPVEGETLHFGKN